MTPNRPGKVIAKLKMLPDNEIVSHTSIQGRHVVSSVFDRPIVVENDGDSFRWHRIGLTAPGRGPSLVGTTTGQLIGEFAVSAARYDSRRQIYSELVPLSLDDAAPSPALVNPPTEAVVPAEDAGNDLSIDGISRNGIRQRGVVLEGLNALDGARSIAYTKVDVALKRGSDALTGTVKVFLDGVESETIDAATLTTSFEFYEFPLKGQVPVPVVDPNVAPRVVNLDVVWTPGSGGTGANKKVIVRGYRTPGTQPDWFRLAGATTPTASEIASDILTPESGTALEFFKRLAENPASPVKYIKYDPNKEVGLYPTPDDGHYSYYVSSQEKIKIDWTFSNSDSVFAQVEPAAGMYVSVRYDDNQTGSGGRDPNSRRILTGTIAADPAPTSAGTAPVTGTFYLENWTWHIREAEVSAGRIDWSHNATQPDLIVLGLPILYDRIVPYPTGAAIGDFIDFRLSVTTVENVNSPTDVPGSFYFDKAGGGITVGSLDQLLGDQATDDYDHIAILLFAYDTNQFYVSKLVPVVDIDSTTTVTVDSYLPLSDEIYVPEQWMPMPAGRIVSTVSNGGIENLVIAGQIGYDCFLHQPRLDYYVPTVRLTSEGVITFAENVSAYRDGNHLFTAYDKDDNVIVKGFISSDTTGLGVNQALVCSDFARTTPITFDNDQFNDITSQRWEVRLQVTGTATRGSDRIVLSDARAYQFFAQQGVQLLGLDGYARVSKVATHGGTYDGSLDDGDLVGDEIVLEAPWQFDSGVGMLSIIPRAKTIFFSRSVTSREQGALPYFESTGAGYAFDVRSKFPIKTLTTIGGQVIAITEADQIFTLNPNGFIVDPTDFDSALSFSIRQFYDDGEGPFSSTFTCVSPHTWLYPTRKVGFIGSEGPMSFDFVELRNIVAESMKSYWNGLDRSSLARASVAVDSKHPYTQAVRIAGMRSLDSTKRDQQLVYLEGRQMFLNFPGHAPQITAMTTVTMQDGSQRIMFGGSGRLYLYGNPPRENQNDPPNDIYLFPYVGGTQYGEVTATTSGGSPALVDSSADFQLLGQGYAWKGTGIRLVKWDTDGNKQWATVTGVVDATTLLVDPDSAWTFTPGDLYIVGALEWEVTLPQFIPKPPYKLVQIESFHSDMKDRSTINYPFQFKFEGTNDGPNLDSTLSTEKFLRSDMDALWAEDYYQVGPDYSVRVTISGVRPPDANGYLRTVEVGLRYSYA